MRTILVIGIGTGRPTLLTTQATSALERVDVFFALDKGEGRADLVAVRRGLAERFGRPEARFVTADDASRGVAASPEIYGEGVSAWTRARAALYRSMIDRELDDGECGGILAWGDPALYDSSLRILADVFGGDAGGDGDGDGAFVVEVVPGISSIQLLAAAHCISLTRVGRPLTVTTGRRLRDEGFPPGTSDVVVMLDGGDAFSVLDEVDTEIFWGAYLATDEEILVSGRLGDVGDTISKIRAQAREKHGWIMDTYLLRRPIPHSELHLDPVPSAIAAAEGSP